MTSATQAVDKARWEARAITLAEEHHLTGRTRYLGVGVHGESLWEVPSVTTGSVYMARVWPVTMGAVCSCLAMSFGHRACGHAGAAILAERQKQAAERGSESDTAVRWLAHGGPW
ncbi:MAG TPA: hypothetical protein VGS80_21525 [Ktedonobacterales bacterium]|nr:hypothetical protein [Ktedonobacterales bacterium]